VERRITQGSILATILYNIFANYIVESVKSSEPVEWAIDWSKYKMEVVQYADDIVLLAKNKTHLQTLLDKSLAHANLNQYVFNCSKSVTFAEEEVLLGGEVVPKSNSLNYLSLNFNKLGFDKEKFGRLS
jgi:hypothetical protein